MKSRPILFSGPMVCAILDGRKSQTRRLVKPQPEWLIEVGRTQTGPGPFVWPIGTFGQQCGMPLALKWNVGDELWVRETWQDSPDGTIYRATKEQHGACEPGGDAPWRPSIFMPRSRSRLTLVVKSVRVERLSAITRDDAVAEGFPGTFGTEELEGLTPADEYIVAFRALNKLAADADPLVWVIEFARKQGGAA